MVGGFVCDVVSLVIVAFHCLLLLALFVVFFLFGACFDMEYTVRSVLSSFAQIWLAKNVVVSLLLPSCCRMAVSVLCLHIMVLCVVCAV